MSESMTPASEGGFPKAEPVEPADLAAPLSANPGEPAASAESTRTSRSVRIWQWIIVGVLAFFVVLLGARLVQTKQTEHRASGAAPDFAFTTFDGQQISLADLKGQGVVLNFWASWCDPCREEAALLQAASVREAKNNVAFVGLDYLDQEPAAKAYLKEYGITYPSGPDLQSAAARRYGISGVPETFFIDPQGNIAEVVIGPISDEARLESLLQEVRP